jgi:hypothetical protein
MDEIRISETIDHPRRRFFGAAAVTIAAAQLGMIGSSDAQTKLPAVKPGAAMAQRDFFPAKRSATASSRRCD